MRRRLSLLAGLTLLLGLAGLAEAGRGARPAAKKVIVFVGLPGSGKSTAADRLAARFGIKKMSTGDLVRAEVKRRGLPNDEVSDRTVAEAFARTPGELGRRAAHAVEQEPGEVSIVEGFRTVADLDNFLPHFPHATVVSIEVGAQRRYARMLKRGRVGEDDVAFLRDRDRSEINRGGSPATGVRAAMRRATIRIRPRGNDTASLDRSLDRVWKVATERAAAATH